jgi:multisubunit Na+/H+ antiporter MnhB subunit
MKNKDEVISFIFIVLLMSLSYLFYTAIFKIQPPLMVEKPPIEKFLWTYRGLDVLAQSFLVFAAAIAIASLFRIEEKRGE